MKKNSAILTLVIGVALILIGLFLKPPGDKLSTYLSDEETSEIEEYVGGDAYNYIIGASLVSGEISGKIAMKAIFISVGTLIFCISLIIITSELEKEKVNEKKLSTADVNNKNVLTSLQPQPQIVNNSLSDNVSTN